MIRILHVVPSLNINSGVMSVIMNYYRNIDHNQIQFDFLFFSVIEPSYEDEIRNLGGRTFCIQRPTFSHHNQMMLRDFFSKHKGEFFAVHCHPIWTSFVFAKEAKRSGIKHIIQHIHSTRYSEKKISAIRNKLLITFVTWFATDYIACNNEAVMLFGKRLAKSGKVFVLLNAIDVGKYSFSKQSRSSIRDEFNIPDDSLVIGNVGRLSIEKNQKFIVEVFNELVKKDKDAKLMIVGEGPLHHEIENHIKEIGVQDRVFMTGRRKDIQDILSALDLFIMPSLFEGTPVSALEARSSGLPCLLSDTITKSVNMRGMRYLSINEKPDRWAEEIENLIEEWKTYDRHDYSEVVRHGYDIHTEAKRLQNYYLELR